jgi:hypothetical protein
VGGVKGLEKIEGLMIFRSMSEINPQAPDGLLATILLFIDLRLEFVSLNQVTHL